MNTPIVIQYENGDKLIHTDAHPYCDDETCPCWCELDDLLAEAEQRYFNLSYLEPVAHPEQYFQGERGNEEYEGDLSEEQVRDEAQERNRTIKLPDGSWW